MKKLILIIGIFLLSFFNVDAQTNFIENIYYTQTYNISAQRVDWNSYYEFNKKGKAYYEIWKGASWRQYTGYCTYNVWQYNSRFNYYQWFQYQGNGTYYYFNMINYKRYYYYYNNVKYYNN